MAPKEYDRIVNLLYLAGAGSIRWDEVLTEIARSLGIMGTQIIAVDKRLGSIIYSFEGGSFDPQFAVDYIREYHQCNPRLDLAVRLKPGEWMHCQEHFNDSYVAADRFYQDFYIPYGARYLSGTKLIDTENVMVLFGAMLAVGGQPLQPVAQEVLERLREHMVSALKLFDELRTKQVELQVGRMIVQRLRQPVALIDSSRGIRHLNEAAEEFLQQSVHVYRADNSLRCRHADDETRMLEEIRSLLIPQFNTVDQNRTVLRLSTDSSQAPTLLMLSAIEPAKTQQAFGNMPLAMVTFHQVGKSQQLDPIIAAEAYNLTPAEARVAVALADGQTPAQIAKARSVALSTIKTQIKTAYVKMGIRSQAELVRRLLELPQI